MKRLILFCTVLCLLLQGCGIVSGVYVPKEVPSNSISYDAGERNSGIVGEAGSEGFEVTPRFVVRYNAMIEVYGTKFTPVLKLDEGVKKMDNGNFFIDNEHMVKFVQMNRWRKSGIAP